MAAFSERLKTLRKENKLSQKEFGERLNIPRTTIANWETGNRTPDLIVLKNLADYFKVTVDYLVGRSDIRNPLGTEERIKVIIQSDPEIDSFLEQLTYRDDLKQLSKILKNLPDKSIERLIRITLAVEGDVSDL